MRRTRRHCAFVTLLGFFAFQWMVAAHACALELHSFGTPTAVAASSPAAHHCGAPDTVPAKLCLEHCSQGKDATSSAAGTDVPAAAAVAFFTVRPVLLAAVQNDGMSSGAPHTRSHSPPPLVLSQRLRI